MFAEIMRKYHEVLVLCSNCSIREYNNERVCMLFSDCLLIGLAAPDPITLKMRVLGSGAARLIIYTYSSSMIT